MAVYNVFNQLPRLVIDAENVTGSFRSWFKKYELASRLAEINMGTEKNSNDEIVPKFRGETKLLALLNSIGSDGIDVLESQGFDLNSNTEGDYKTAIELLKNYYDKKESEHVAWVKAATLSQNCGESELEFLLRVEKRSRNLGFIPEANIEQLRQRFATSMALVGLRDESVRKKLMMDEKLDWKSLNDTLKARSIAINSSQILTEARSGSLQASSNSATINKISSSSSFSKNGRYSDEKGYDSRDFNGDSRSRYRSKSPGRTDSSSRRRSMSNNRYDNNSRDLSRDRNRNSSRDRYQNDSRGRDRYRSNSRDVFRNNSRDRFRNDSRDRFSRAGSRERYRNNSPGNHRTSSSYMDSSHHRSPDYRDSQGRRGGGYNDKCYVCHRPGHIALDCPDIKCYACGKRGHTANNCDQNRVRSNSSNANRSDSYYNESKDSLYTDKDIKSSAVRFNNS